MKIKFLTTIIRLNNKLINIFTGWYKHITGEYDVRLFTKRLAICSTCSYKNENLDICKLCLCPLKAKLKVEDEECPIGKWKKK